MRKYFQNQCSLKAGKQYFEIGFYKYSVSKRSHFTNFSKKFIKCLQYYHDPPWLDPEKIFKLKVLRRLARAILRLFFGNKALHTRAILLIFQEEISRIYYKTQHVWAHRKKFQNKCSQIAGKRYFGVPFCKYSKYFL